MEIAPFPSRPSRSTFESASPAEKAFFNPPDIFYSTADAYDALKNKTFSLVKPHEAMEIHTAMYKTIFLTVGVFSIVAAMATFVTVSNNHAYYDHAADFVTPYKYKGFWCSATIDRIITKDGFWINHTGDLRILNVDEGLKAMLPIAILPPLCYLIVYKLSTLLTQKYCEYYNRPVERSIKRIELSKAILKNNTASINDQTPASPDLISELIELDVLSKQDGKKLSFLQTQVIKNSHPKLFSELLENQEFSELHCLSWHTIKLMKEMEAQVLTKALARSDIADLLAAEPSCLEVLIQELEPEKLTEGLLTVLVNKFKMLSQKLACLPAATLIQAAQKMSQQKCSLKRALELTVPAGDSNEEIELLFANQVASLKVSKAVLCHFSSTFRDLFEDLVEDTVEEKIVLYDTDAAAFKAALEYVMTGKFSIDKENLPHLLHVANAYDFALLKEALEQDLSRHVQGEFEVGRALSLLQQCKSYDLGNLRKRIDIAFHMHLSAILEEPIGIEKFMALFKLAEDYHLEIAKKTLFKVLNKQIHAFASADDLSKLLIGVVTAVDDPGLHMKIFDIVAPLFEKKPTWLKPLWERALSKNCLDLQKIIVAFCQREGNYLYLACWPTPPCMSNSAPFQLIIA